MAAKTFNLQDTFLNQARKENVSVIVHLVNGFQPRELPPPDYFAMMRELYGIGRNLNQIAQKAHVLGVIDAQRYDEEVNKLDSFILKLTDAVINPMPIS